jgi:hypothetical protein
MVDMIGAASDPRVRRSSGSFGAFDMNERAGRCRARGFAPEAGLPTGRCRGGASCDRTR